MIIHIWITHIFLFLDTIFFPKFRSKKVENPVFIVGVPRSGTSFLLNLVANNREVFTSFKLWELVFAPSIIQKVFWLTIGKAFSVIGISTSIFFNWIDSLFFKKMQGIHDLGLQTFEEDEFVYLYLFKSVYLMFIFPELEDVHQFVYPDNSDNLKSRIKEQQFYKSLIKRHLYIFNKNNNKCFLSKNPIHPIRLESLTTVFPNAKYLLLERPLEKTIPSTISLNLNLYRYFCSIPNENPLRITTIKMLIEWHQYFQHFNQKNNKNTNWQTLTIDFKNMVKTPSKEAQKIHAWLQCPMSVEYQNYLQQQDEFSKNYQSRHQYKKLTNDELKMFVK